MNRFASCFLFYLGLTQLSPIGAVPSAHAAEKPNILLIVADDLGWNDVGYHGSHCKTPNIDRLVSLGVELDQHYVQPVCTPTRAALLSGRYPSRFGPHATSPSNRRVFDAGTTTLASALQLQGYETYLAGKWHLGSRMEWGPNEYGFQHTYGSLAGAADPWTHKYRKGPYARTWHRDETFVKEEGNVTELLTYQVIQWIKEKRRPWFVYVPFTAVHIPIDTPRKYTSMYEDAKFDDDPERNESLKRFAAYVSQLDDKVGEIIKALERTGQLKNTLVIFTSDNGGLLSGGNAYISEVPPTVALSSNLPLRGQKAQLFEGGIRVPAFVYWPNKLSPRKVSHPMHVADWMPTLTHLVGWKSKDDLKWDGQDVWPLITGETTQPEPRTFYWSHVRGKTNTYALRSGDWKLILNPKKEFLFNLAKDPYEKTNLIDEQPEITKKLRAQIEEYKKADRAEVPKDLQGITN